jgi:mRNA interferase YafQ
MFTCNFTNKFKKDYKKSIKRGCNMQLFEEVYDILEKTGELPAKYKPHPLTGNWVGYIDAHIQPDWILIFKVDKKENEIDFVRLSTHSDLF